MFSENEQLVDREINPIELISDMMEAQQRLLHNANIRYNNTDVSTQQLIRHYAVNINEKKSF